MPSAIFTCSEYFTDQALNEIRRYQPTVQFIKSLSPKHHLIQTSCSFNQLTSPWRHKLPIYLHHLFPVQYQAQLDNRLDKFVQQVCHHVSKFDVVQVHIVGDCSYSAYDIRHAICPHPNRKRQNTQVLSILIVDGDCTLGISPITHNLSRHPMGRPYFSEAVPNRAGLKLMEALDVFGIRLRKNAHALDLGAAPGAWTTVLRRHGLHVTAVAPAMMYDWLQDDPCITHFNITAEDYIHRCDTTYDIIVNDMIMDAQDSAHLMVKYANHLRENGIAIMTIKLRLWNTMRVLDHSYRILRKAYKIIQVRQLVSNKKEVTLFLRKK